MMTQASPGRRLNDVPMPPEVVLQQPEPTTDWLETRRWFPGGANPFFSAVATGAQTTRVKREAPWYQQVAALVDAAPNLAVFHRALLPCVDAAEGSLTLSAFVDRLVTTLVPTGYDVAFFRRWYMAIGVPTPVLPRGATPGGLTSPPQPGLTSPTTGGTPGFRSIPPSNTASPARGTSTVGGKGSRASAPLGARSPAGVPGSEAGATAADDGGVEPDLALPYFVVLDALHALFNRHDNEAARWAFDLCDVGGTGYILKDTIKALRDRDENPAVAAAVQRQQQLEQEAAAALARSADDAAVEDPLSPVFVGESGVLEGTAADGTTMSAEQDGVALAAAQSTAARNSFAAEATLASTTRLGASTNTSSNANTSATALATVTAPVARGSGGAELSAIRESIAAGKRLTQQPPKRTVGANEPKRMTRKDYTLVIEPAAELTVPVVKAVLKCFEHISDAEMEKAMAGQGKGKKKKKKGGAPVLPSMRQFHVSFPEFAAIMRDDAHVAAAFLPYCVKRWLEVRAPPPASSAIPPAVSLDAPLEAPAQQQQQQQTPQPSGPPPKSPAPSHRRTPSVGGSGTPAPTTASPQPTNETPTAGAPVDAEGADKPSDGTPPPPEMPVAAADATPAA